MIFNPRYGRLGMLTLPTFVLTDFITAIAENFGFRQFCSFWRIRGMFQHFRGMKTTWGSMERKGFSTAEDE